MCTLDSVKTFFEIAAYIAALAFFGFKSFSGVGYVSLSLAINTDRRKELNDREDVLVINLSLTGGENALLDIYKVEGKISYNNSKESNGSKENKEDEKSTVFTFKEIEVFTFKEIERLDVKNEDNDLKINPKWEADKKNKYRINVMETTSFAEVIAVPKNAICRIDIIVVGSRKKISDEEPTISQWRASHISLPN